MKFSDILALAKQGYTPSDIKELIALPVEQEQQETVGESLPTDQQEQSKEAVSTDVDAVADQASRDTEQDNADKIKELESEIKRLQEENIRIAQPAKQQEKTPQDRLNDLARSFM